MVIDSSGLYMASHRWRLEKWSLQTLIETTTTTDTITTTETTDTLTTTETTETLTTSPVTTPTSQNQPCVIATASFGSGLAPEVSYMRHVRDNMIGSTDIGKILVVGWNAFYYSWSPPVASMISNSEILQSMFRILLLPLIAIIHSTAFIYSAIMPLSLTSASILGFLFAAISSTITYILIPSLALKLFFKKRMRL